MAPLFQKAAESLTTSLTVHSAHYYQCTGRHFLNYLDTQYPRVRSLRQLRRDPHILDWLTLLRSHEPPLAKVTYAHYVIRLRRIFEELAWTKGVPLLTRLVRADDIPHPDRCLPRPLTAEQDQLIQQELLRRDDWVSNALLLLRHTGMRIGECLDLPIDCLRSVGEDQWAVHVPLGKLRTERLVPVDAFVCVIVRRLQQLRSQDARVKDGFLLARPRSRSTLGYELRTSFHEIAASVGIRTRLVPHQFRHSFATEMLRAGVSLPVLMKLLGHTSPNMTMRYLEISLSDVQHEFQLAQLHPRHLIPALKTPSANSLAANLSGLLDSIQGAQHVLEMYRRTLAEGPARRLLDRLANRLTKIASEARTIDHA
jgi:integrase